VRNSDSIDLASRTLNFEVDVDNSEGRIRTGAYALVHLKVPDGTATSPQSLVILQTPYSFAPKGFASAWFATATPN
jgi:hypothetical protein